MPISPPNNPAKIALLTIPSPSPVDNPFTMKTFIILILGTLLALGSYLSKPTEADFRKMIHANMESQKKTDLIQLILHGGKGQADLFLQSCKFNDHILWTDV